MKKITLLVLLSLVTSVAWGIEAKFQADSLHGALGDVITFGWDIEHGSESEVKAGQIILDGTGIEILKQEIIPGKNGSTLHFNTAIYDSVGIYHFPSFNIYTTAGAIVDSLSISGPDLQILSVLTASDTTFRDIKGLHKINRSLDLAKVLLLLAIAVLAYLGYILYKRYYNPVPDDPGVVIIPPEEAHIIALRALSDLEKSLYLQQNHFKQYHSDLIHILKQYYENRFLIDALEKTTGELLDKMNSMDDFDNSLLTNTKRILESADIIKFAKGESSIKKSISEFDTVNEIVERTMIIPEVLEQSAIRDEL
jgi:hypothetical protein